MQMILSMTNSLISSTRILEFRQKVPASFSDMHRISEKEAGTFWRGRSFEGLVGGFDEGREKLVALGVADKGHDFFVQAFVVDQFAQGAVAFVNFL